MADSVSFSGGAGLERALRDLSKKLTTPGTLRVGFLEGATYSDGSPVANVAAIQEFGAPAAKVPPRPFFRTTISQHNQEWAELLAERLQASDYNLERSLHAVGQLIEGQLRQSIVDMNDPALSPITLMLRKMKAQNPNLKVSGSVVAEAARRVALGMSTAGVSTKPLVDTGVMLNSISSEVTQDPPPEGSIK